MLPFETSVEDPNVLSEEIPFKNQVLEEHVELEDMYDPNRGQYKGRGYLEVCSKRGEKLDDIVIGLTDHDLFTGHLNFIFGLAEKDGKGCIISTHRLGDGEKMKERMIKEAVHEIGHVVGLEHCSNRRCVMHFSNSLLDTDKKSKWYCRSCEKRFESLLKKRRIFLDY